MQSLDHPAVLMMVSIGTLFTTALVDALLVLCGVKSAKSIPASFSPNFSHLAIVLWVAAECGFCVTTNRLDSDLRFLFF